MTLTSLFRKSRARIRARKKPAKKNRRDAGFGFLGMAVLVMLMTLGASIVYTLTTPTNSAIFNRQTQIKAVKLRSAITAYKMSHGGTAGTNPTTLAALVTDDAVACAMNNTPASVMYLTLQGWCGPYLDRENTNNLTDYQTDGWGTAFSYNNGTNVLTSCGVDRTCSTGDDLTFNP